MRKESPPGEQKLGRQCLMGATQTFSNQTPNLNQTKIINTQSCIQKEIEEPLES